MVMTSTQVDEDEQRQESLESGNNANALMA